MVWIYLVGFIDPQCHRPEYISTSNDDTCEQNSDYDLYIVNIVLLCELSGNAQGGTYKLPPMAVHSTPPYRVYRKDFCHYYGNPASKISRFPKSECPIDMSDTAYKQACLRGLPSLKSFSCRYHFQLFLVGKTPPLTSRAARITTGRSVQRRRRYRECEGDKIRKFHHKSPGRPALAEYKAVL